MRLIAPERLVSVTASGAASVRTGDGRVIGIHGHAEANRYGNADFLCNGQGTAGPLTVRHAVHVWRALAGKADAPHLGGRRQRHRSGDLHALGGGRRFYGY